MNQGRTAKLIKRSGRQSIQLPAEWKFPGEEVYLWRDGASGNILISALDRQPRRQALFPRIVAELFTGWLVFVVIVVFTVLSQKLVDWASKGELTGYSLQGYHFVAYGFEFALFVLYNVLKIYEFVRPQSSISDSDLFHGRQVTWTTFAKSATATFFKTFAGLFRPRAKKPDPGRVEVLVGKDNIAMLVKMMRTAMTDEEIREAFRSKGYPDVLD